MAWQAVCRGANGIVFYSCGFCSCFVRFSGLAFTIRVALNAQYGLRYFDIKRNDDMPFETQWSHLSAVAAEIDRFAPVLLSDEGAAPPVTASLKSGDGSPAWLATRARWGPSAAQAGKGGKDFYLFVANDGNGAGKVQFQLAGTSIGADGVSVVSETPPRKIQPDDASSFSDEVKRLDVVVYRFTPK